MKLLYCSICNEKKEEKAFSSKEKQSGNKRKCTECGKKEKKEKEKDSRSEVLAYIYGKRKKKKINKERVSEKEQAIERKKMTPQKTKEILKKNNGKCIYCEDEANTADHLTPIKYGGKTEDGNLEPSCLFCNNIKDDMTYSEFIELKRNFSDEKWKQLKNKFSKVKE